MIERPRPTAVCVQEYQRLYALDPIPPVGTSVVSDLLAEIDALRAERDDARSLARAHEGRARLDEDTLLAVAAVLGVDASRRSGDELEQAANAAVQRAERAEAVIEAARAVDRWSTMRRASSETWPAGEVHPSELDLHEALAAFDGKGGDHD